MNTLDAKPDTGRRSALLDRALVSAFFENIPDCVYFKDCQSRYLAVSKSVVRHFGVASAAEIVGRTAFDFFAAEHAARVFADEQQVLRTGEPILGRLEREIFPDDRVRWALTNRLPLRNEDGRLIGTFGIGRDVTKKHAMEEALAKAHQELVDASRIAGMAEVATGVLHNVGNVLSSLNVSASVIATGLRQSKAGSLGQLAVLLRAQQASFGEFLTTDSKGRRVPEFLASLARHAVTERARLLEEVGSLQKNIDHIKEIVSMQQAYASLAGVSEPLDPATLMEDALRMNAGALSQREVQVTREFDFVPPVFAEKAKVLQILINLIRNAKYACDEAGAAEKRVTLRIEAAAGIVRFIVRDNGIGIPAENFTRIFSHGFTTRANGHGFGLHSAANAAREMKGALTVHSEGHRRGATFTLELPAATPAVGNP